MGSTFTSAFTVRLEDGAAVEMSEGLATFKKGLLEGVPEELFPENRFMPGFSKRGLLPLKVRSG